MVTYFLLLFLRAILNQVLCYELQVLKMFGTFLEEPVLVLLRVICIADAVLTNQPS